MLKKSFLFTLILTISFQFAFADKSSSKTTIVTDFQTVNIDNDVSIFFSDTVRKELSSYSTYKVIPRNEMLKLIKAEEINKAVLWDSPSKASLIGGMTGAEIIITGKLEKHDNSFSITLYQIDVKSNRYTKIIKVKRKLQQENLYILADDAVKRLVFSKEGSIKLDTSNEFNSPKMLYVPKGSFTMGDNRGYRNQRPAHKVSITHNFYIARFEITNREYCNMLNYAQSKNYLKISNDEVENKIGKSKTLVELDLEDDDRKIQIFYNGKSFEVKSGCDNLPVVGITWYGAAFYCNILSEIESVNKLYNLKDWRSVLFNKKGYRLPTEAEWEYAARGGRNSKGYLYSGGKKPHKTGWFIENSDQRTHQKGLLSPNELGIYDMTGNVSEWCNDYYEAKYYKPGSKTNPTGPSYRYAHTIRGGDWNSRLKQCTVTYRDYEKSEDSTVRTGFRPVLIIP